MKIIFLTSSFAKRYGGAAHSEQGLTKLLGETESVVLLSRRERYESGFSDSLNIKKTILFKPLDVLLAFLNLNKELSHQIREADVFHLNGHWFFENYFFARLCKRYQVPYVLHPRGMLLVGHRRKGLKRIFNFLIGNYIVRNADKIIALSEYEKKQFFPYRIEQEKIEIIPNGVVVPEFKDKGKGPQKHFLYFGRLESRKNLKFLISAFSKTPFKDNKIELHLTGPVEHGYDKLIRQWISHSGMENRIKIFHPVYGIEKWQMLREALAVVYPAVEEAFGRVPFEAMGTGGLAIVPDQSGGAEYLKQLFPELIYNEGHEESLVQKLLVVEAMNSVDRNEMSERSKTWVAENLNWAVIKSQVMNLYRKSSSQSSIATSVNSNLGSSSF